MASNSVLLGLTALVFCTWSVSLAGIASVQDSCMPGLSNALSYINGFSEGLPCMSFFRYYWFIVSLEFVLVTGLGVSLAVNALSKYRQSWLGVITVATLLYIQMTDAFLSADSVTGDMGGSIKDRVRVMIAGSIMTATVNCFLIIALGTYSEESIEEVAAPADPEAKTVA